MATFRDMVFCQAEAFRFQASCGLEVQVDVELKPWCDRFRAQEPGGNRSVNRIENELPQKSRMCSADCQDPCLLHHKGMNHGFNPLRPSCANPEPPPPPLRQRPKRLKPKTESSSCRGIGFCRSRHGLRLPSTLRATAVVTVPLVLSVRGFR